MIIRRENNHGPAEYTYIILNTTIEKPEPELNLARIIRAVEEDDVAELVLNTNIIRNLMDNLNAFARQELRCTRCNPRYRWVPMTGK